MSKSVKSLRLFGGEATEKAVVRAPQDEDAPEFSVSEKSRRLRDLPAHLRELVPWFAGAVAHSERYGSLAQQARAYRLMAIGLAVVCVLLAWGLVRMASEVADTRVVPYIVQVDEHGYAVPVGPMERIAEMDARFVMASIARWVSAFRTVAGDARSQQARVQEAFTFVGKKSVAAQKLNEWYAQHPPDGEVGRRVEVEITRVSPLQSGSEFTVEWSETESDGSGTPPVKSLYSAVVNVRISPTQKLADVIVNPLGAFVTDFSISKLQ